MVAASGGGGAPSGGVGVGGDAGGGAGGGVDGGEGAGVGKRAGGGEGGPGGKGVSGIKIACVGGGTSSPYFDIGYTALHGVVEQTCKRNPVMPLKVAHPVMPPERFVGRVGPHSHLALKGWSGLPGPISVNSPSCLWRLWYKAITSIHHRGVQSLARAGVLEPKHYTVNYLQKHSNSSPNYKSIN